MTSQYTTNGEESDDDEDEEDETEDDDDVTEDGASPIPPPPSPTSNLFPFLQSQFRVTTRLFLESSWCTVLARVSRPGVAWPRSLQK